MMKNKISFLTIISGLWCAIALANLDQYKEHSVVVLSKDSQGKVYVGSAPVGSTVTISKLHEECPDYFIASDCECTISSYEQVTGLYEVQVPTLPESYVHFTLQIDAQVQVLRVMIVKNNIFEQSFFNVTTVAQFDPEENSFDDLDFLLEGSRSEEEFVSAGQKDPEITYGQTVMLTVRVLANRIHDFLEKSSKESSDWMQKTVQESSDWIQTLIYS